MKNINCPRKYIHTLDTFTASLVKFLTSSLHEIFTNVGLCYSGKINGNSVTEGNRYNIPLVKFVTEYQLDRNVQIEARDLLKCHNIGEIKVAGLPRPLGAVVG